MAQFSKDDDDKRRPGEEPESDPSDKTGITPGAFRVTDDRPWRERVKERRENYERHWLSCVTCQELTAEVRAVMIRNNEPGWETYRHHCWQGEHLRTMWLTEPK